MAVARRRSGARSTSARSRFALAPRLNAAGRLYRADAGLELILTEDPARAAQIAAGARLAPTTSAGRSRRGSASRPKRRCAELGERPAYVLAGEGWHAGVIGIVASRLAERQHRPVVMIALDGDARQGLGAQHRGVRPARRA